MVYGHRFMNQFLLFLNIKTMKRDNEGLPTFTTRQVVGKLKMLNAYPLYLAKNRGEVYQQGEFLVKYAGKRDSWHMYKACKPQAA